MHFRDAADKEGEHTAVLDAVKQIGFYTDCYGDRHWSLPSEVISPDLAKQLVMTAEVLSQRAEISPREVELWTEIMKPVWETPAMREALIRWHEAMKREGLTSRAQEQFERFLLGPEAGPASDKGPDPT
jgi:hypothetical protein